MTTLTTNITTTAPSLPLRRGPPPGGAGRLYPPREVGTAVGMLLHQPPPPFSFLEMTHAEHT